MGYKRIYLMSDNIAPAAVALLGSSIY